LRVQRISVSQWRHFRDIELEVPDNAPIVSLVGANGVGKSQLLELIAACAGSVGLSHGANIPRGNPLGDDAKFEITFEVAKGTCRSLEESGIWEDNLAGELKQWDRTLTVSRRAVDHREVLAGGVSEQHSQAVAQAVVDAIGQSLDVHYLFLDADRAYPKRDLNTHQLAEAYSTDWERGKKDSSSKLVATLYEEWFRFLLGKENQDNNSFVQSIRASRDAGENDPEYTDPMLGYRDALKTVLPHLTFVGVDSQAREVKFNSTGVPLTFDKLSGGEREIAFLIGQVERFGLRNGLLLIDEPELHLNYDLLRAWIGFLKSTVDVGQIWLATHSLEVVEIAGQDSTFLLERDEKSPSVKSAASLRGRPVVAALSRAVGSPAFSLANIALVMVEGEALVGERERFRLLCESPSHVRFFEAGSCQELVRRKSDFELLAQTGGQHLRLGGVVDGDWRDKSERQEITNQGLYVLDVHEIENLFLHPPTLSTVAKNLGQGNIEPRDLVQEIADDRAGVWIFDHARTHRRFKEYPPPSSDSRTAANSMHWADFDQGIDNACAALVADESNLMDQQREKLKQALVASAKIYSKKREGDDLWKVCHGKEVFRAASDRLGFKSASVAEAAIIQHWTGTKSDVPEALKKLRRYILSL
jgi:predicted ATPase